jgi:hypothetical protein
MINFIYCLETDMDKSMKFNFNTNEEIVEWLKQTRLINPRRICDGCARPMRWAKKANNSDGCVWRCGKCQKMCTIREGSFFAGIRLQLIEIVHLAWYWALQLPMVDTAREMEISRTTVTKYNQLFRQIAIKNLKLDTFKVRRPDYLPWAQI